MRSCTWSPGRFASLESSTYSLVAAALVANTLSLVQYFPWDCRFSGDTQWVIGLFGPASHTEFQVGRRATLPTASSIWRDNFGYDRRISGMLKVNSRGCRLFSRDTRKVYMFEECSHPRTGQVSTHLQLKSSCLLFSANLGTSINRGRCAGRISSQVFDEVPTSKSRKCMISRLRVVHPHLRPCLYRA